MMTMMLMLLGSLQSDHIFDGDGSIVIMTMKIDMNMMMTVMLTMLIMLMQLIYV